MKPERVCESALGTLIALAIIVCIFALLKFLEYLGLG
jgi:hypothetical protein